MKERIVIIFIAVTLGLVITTFGFFLYESAKKPTKDATPTPIVVNPKKENEIFLLVDEPADELVIEKRAISVKGKTDPNNTLIISTNQEDTVAVPTSSGIFNTTISIDAGINKVIIKAVSPDGQSKTIIRTVSFLPEDL